jgi:8-oxo-dGTP diphosphatase
MQWGESVAETALRELREETGVEAALLGLVDVVDGFFGAPGSDSESHYVLIDFAARWTAGEPRADDDADDAAFIELASVRSLGLWPPTLAVIQKAWRLYQGSSE